MDAMDPWGQGPIGSGKQPGLQVWRPQEGYDRFLCIFHGSPIIGIGILMAGEVQQTVDKVAE